MYVVVNLLLKAIEAISPVACIRSIRTNPFVSETVLYVWSPAKKVEDEAVPLPSLAVGTKPADNLVAFISLPSFTLVTEVSS